MHIPPLGVLRPGDEDPIDVLMEFGYLDERPEPFSRSEREKMNAAFDREYEQAPRKQPAVDRTAFFAAHKEYARVLFNAYMDAFHSLAPAESRIIKQNDENAARESCLTNLGETEIEEMRKEEMDPNIRISFAGEIRAERAERAEVSNRKKQERFGFFYGQKELVTGRITRDAMAWLTEDEQGPQLDDTEAMMLIGKASRCATSLGAELYGRTQFVYPTVGNHRGVLDGAARTIRAAANNNADDINQELKGWVR